MAYVSLSDDQTEVTGLYNFPQSNPKPQGYAEIPDDDQRISDFKAKMTALINQTS